MLKTKKKNMFKNNYVERREVKKKNNLCMHKHIKMDTGFGRPVM